MKEGPPENAANADTPPDMKPADAGVAAGLSAVNVAGLDAGQITLSAQTPFEYGWCSTDHKSGRYIRRDWRNTDYMNDEPYATRLHAMLDQLGLPKPKPEEVFRGTHHDLLFLNSHGVVLRIGPTDVQDLMHPGILQPLGWLEDKDNMLKHGKKKVPFTVAVYPGIELADNFFNDQSRDKPELIGSLFELLKSTGQGTHDYGNYNCGVIRVMNDEGREVAVKVMLDADNSFNGSSRVAKVRKAVSLGGQAKDTANNKGQALMNTLRDVFNAVKDVKNWERAFEVHQPLREMFWDAFDGVTPVTGLPNEKKRAAFWEKCASVTNKPQPATMAVWKPAKSGGLTTMPERVEIPVPNLVLYRQWTGQQADRIIKPIQQTDELKAAIVRAHDELVERERASGLAALGKKIMNGLMRV